MKTLNPRVFLREGELYAFVGDGQEAIKVKNEDEASDWLYDEYGEKLLARLHYTLEGYQMEVAEGCKHDCCPVDGRCEHCADPIKLAIISPVAQ